MTRRSEHSLVLLLVCFAFMCLLLGGGSRLIAVQGGEASVPERTDSLICAAFVSAPAPRAETGTPHQREQLVQRRESVPVTENPVLNVLTECDANGNVLKSRPYLREVYQAFVLGDGFV